ncbi:MAG: glycosyltransferase, partial [bacterium]
QAELARCLESVLASNNQQAYELIIINDGSPEAEVHTYLDQFADANPQVTLLKNPQNLGFVATVNRGMRLHDERDVVLLNSDTEVANDWLDRICACGESVDKAASVTPFSNNATICSFPEFPLSNSLPADHSVASLDNLFKTANPGRFVDIPTGVGFCMWIKRDALNEAGLFDEKNFPRGYGEENDFCMRAAGKGWRNLLCCDTFVFHEGGVSFCEETAHLTRNAEKTIDRLHPSYHQLVQEHIALDPARVFRLNASVQLLHQSQKPKILAISHQMGGGIRKHIEHLQEYLSDEAEFLLLRPIDEHNVALYLNVHHSSQVISFRIPARSDELVELLRFIGITRLHYHHALDIDESIWHLADRLDVAYDVTLHDHFFINGNPAQCDEDGKYCADLAQQSTPFPLPLSIDEWQALQHARLIAAERILCPSAFTAERYREFYPDLDITTVFHPDWEDETPYPDTLMRELSAERPLRVLVLGALSKEKGADVLEKVATLARSQQRPFEFHLLGYGYRPLAREVHMHGAYEHRNVKLLIDDLKPDLCWFPALIPETFSYTLSEALASGLPILASNIGAFPQRLIDRPLTWLSNWDNNPEEWLQSLETARHELLSAQQEDRDLCWSAQPLPTHKFYALDYLHAVEHPAIHSTANIDIEWLGKIFADAPLVPATAAPASRRERWLVRLFRLRNSRLGRILSRLIPFELQRKIKRRLSARPLHELDN